MAQKGLPTIFTPGMVTGAGAPVTIAGALVQGNAEMLAGFVLAQLIRPGTPLVYGGGLLPIDMRTTLMAYGAPEGMLGVSALKEMARHYRLPCSTLPVAPMRRPSTSRLPSRARCG